MQVPGKIVIFVNDKPKGLPPMQYGFVKAKGMKEQVFFNTLSKFQNVDFEDLKLGDSVRIIVKETSRGPYAESLTVTTRKRIVRESKQEIPPVSQPPEANP